MGFRVYGASTGSLKGSRSFFVYRVLPAQSVRFREALKGLAL